ncbi:hypothetical protein ACHAWF_001777 [Thalassiosira exigua]
MMTMRLELLNNAVAFLATGGRAAGFFTPPARTRHDRRGGTVVRNKLAATSATATARLGPSSAQNSRTALDAIPPSAVHALGHIVGGSLSAPLFVIRATSSWYLQAVAPPVADAPQFHIQPGVDPTLWHDGRLGFTGCQIIVAFGGDRNKKLRIIHYALNLAWAPIFFGLKCLHLGLVVNLFLVATLGAVLPLFHKIDPMAAYLLVPYFLWLIFATKLNQAICKLLNPMVDGVNRVMLLVDVGADGNGDGYSNDMLQYDLKLLQAATAKYVG